MSSERYVEQLDLIADLLTSHHPIGKVKAIGRMECLAALKGLLEPTPPPSPPQPGDTVLVPAVIVEPYVQGMMDVRLLNSHSWRRDADGQLIFAFPLSAIHPAPTAAKKGDHK